MIFLNSQDKFLIFLIIIHITKLIQYLVLLNIYINIYLLLSISNPIIAHNSNI